MDVVNVEIALAIACPCKQPDNLIGSHAEDGDPERGEPAVSDLVDGKSCEGLFCCREVRVSNETCAEVGDWWC